MYGYKSAGYAENERPIRRKTCGDQRIRTQGITKRYFERVKTAKSAYLSQCQTSRPARYQNEQPNDRAASQSVSTRN